MNGNTIQNLLDNGNATSHRNHIFGPAVDLFEDTIL